MPWKKRKSSRGGWDIVKTTTGEVVGHSDTERDADASIRARYASVSGERLREALSVLPPSAGRRVREGAPKSPPNLREADLGGTAPHHQCGTCLMFWRGLCWGYNLGEKVGPGQTCDSWDLDPQWRTQMAALGLPTT